MWELDELDIAAKYLTPEEYSLVNDSYASAYFTHLEGYLCNPPETLTEEDLREISRIKRDIEDKATELYNAGYLETDNVEEVDGPFDKHLELADLIDFVMQGLMDKALELADQDQA
jgi:hypothetical protein